MNHSAKLRLIHMFDGKYYVILEVSTDIIDSSRESVPVPIKEATG